MMQPNSEGVGSLLAHCREPGRLPGEEDTGKVGFAAALAEHFSEEGFVAKLPAMDSGCASFLVLFAREPDIGGDQVLSIKVTDCVAGLFQARLNMGTLAELRRDSGMAEFSWGAFLRLLSAALRADSGCSAAAQLKVLPVARPLVGVPTTVEQKHDGSPPKHHCARLALRFQLEAASLVAHIDVPEAIAAPFAVPGAEAYLQALRHFVMGAVTVAGRDTPSVITKPPENSAAAAATLQTQRQQTPTLPPALARGGGSSIASIASVYSAPTPTSERSPSTVGTLAVASSASTPPVATASRKPVVPKKRAGGSLVAPSARRPAPGGGNPFQLSSR